ncbi:MAG TPA: RelA/SpoT family protein, partial [Burkholderiaceae bacterium]|nr:RelA/SpoT family protein [Burkholderiaceae bacterium]
MGDRSPEALRDSTASSSRRSAAPAKLVTADAAAASFAALTSKLDYLDAADIKRVRDAYRFADEAHLGQFRASGEPYITHPIAVAGLCAEWKLDAQAIMAALMHDAMEDCGIPKSELIERFGAPTADLVDGLTKLDKLRFSTREESQAESFRKMLLAMARDVRVILIKLADRLHNMRTLDHMRPAKRRRIANETLEIYAPIANRLGMSKVKNELEELSFRYLEPQAYEALRIKVDAKRRAAEGLIERLRGTIATKLREAGIPYVEVDGRIKRLYSIHQKLRRQRIQLDQVYDFVALRILVGSVPDCYAALGVIHNLWRPVPGRIKDFIAMPRPNGYQSLHTSVIGDLGHPFEIQIRTREMHRIAEEGIAAHWKYKEGRTGFDKDDRAFTWLRQLLEWQQEVKDPHEFLNSLKLDLYPEEVYCFTPRGEVKTLPRGASPVDFAYAIHTEIGHQCVGARVNGKMVPLRYKLNNGDIVEILTSAGHHPSRDWL